MALKVYENRYPRIGFITLKPVCEELSIFSCHGYESTEDDRPTVSNIKTP